MRSVQRFFICNHCGNLIGIIGEKAAPLVCCGEEMSELVPNTVEASKEKHLPDVKVSADKITVQVGSAPHPMEDGHLIKFVYLETENGGQRKALAAGGEPKAVFAVIDDKPIAVYAYCNLHGLWKTVIE